AAKGRPLPHSPRHELKRARLDLLSGAGDPDDHGNAPATVTTLQRLAHEIDVAHALEAVVGATVGERNQVLHEIATHVLRIDKVRHAESLGERFAARIDIDADDLVRADHAGALNGVESNTPESEHHHIRAGFDFRGVDHRPNPGCYTAADVT